MNVWQITTRPTTRSTSGVRTFARAVLRLITHEVEDHLAALGEHGQRRLPIPILSPAVTLFSPAVTLFPPEVTLFSPEVTSLRVYLLDALQNVSPFVLSVLVPITGESEDMNLSDSTPRS